MGMSGGTQSKHGRFATTGYFVPYSGPFPPFPLLSSSFILPFLCISLQKYSMLADRHVSPPPQIPIFLRHSAPHPPGSTIYERRQALTQGSIIGLRLPSPISVMYTQLTSHSG